MKSGFWTDERTQSVILFDFEVWQLPKTKHHLGPHIDQGPRDQERFLEKYAGCRPYVSEGRWVVDTEREFREVEELFPVVLGERRGFGKNLRDSTSISVVSGEKIVTLGGEDFRCFLGGFLPPQGP
jgi:tRNA nucleotidyltransferase (CCA-adding enzyme)